MEQAAQLHAGAGEGLLPRAQHTNLLGGHDTYSSTPQPRIVLWRRQRNFTLALEGATTEEAIAAERRAAFEAAETRRLQVPACCFRLMQCVQLSYHACVVAAFVHRRQCAPVWH